MKHMKYWIQWIAGTIGIAAAGGLVPLVLAVLNIGGQSDGRTAFWENIVRLYAAYLLLTGVFVVSITVIAYFQGYTSLLISMNCTRFEAAAGIVVATAAVILILTGVSYAIGQICPNGGMAGGDLRAVLMFVGAGFAACSLFLVMGASVIRWGKIGVIVATVLYAVLGGCIGASAVMLRNEWTWSVRLLDQEMAAELLAYAPAVLLVGGLLYLLAGGFVFWVIRRMEVRI